MRKKRPYVPANPNYQIHVSKLRKHLFPKGIIPLECHDNWRNIKVPLLRGGLLTVTVICTASKSTGYGMKGMRLWVLCPECGQRVSAGRLHQHYGYKH